MKLIKIKCKDVDEDQDKLQEYLKLAKSFEGWKPLGKYGPLKKRPSYNTDVLVAYSCGKPAAAKGYVNVIVYNDGHIFTVTDDHLNSFKQEISSSLIGKVKNEVEKLLQEDEKNWPKILEQRRYARSMASRRF